MENKTDKFFIDKYELKQYVTSVMEEYASLQCAELKKEVDYKQKIIDDLKRQISELRDSLDFHDLINMKAENESLKNRVDELESALGHLIKGAAPQTHSMHIESAWTVLNRKV